VEMLAALSGEDREEGKLMKRSLSKLGGEKKTMKTFYWIKNFIFGYNFRLKDLV
jgi:hypothetical protein